jgi:hypothetical protein
MLSVTASASPSFSANLDAGDFTPTYSVALATQDTTGSGSGWNETITSTQFATGGASGHMLAPDASTIIGVTAAGSAGADTLPANVIAYPLTIPAGSTAPTAVKLFDATAGTGMGRFTVTPTISVSVPQNTFAGTYSSTLTFGIVSGP